MIRRAQRELRVSEGMFLDEHKAVIDAFLSDRELSPSHREIFSKIETYLAHSKTARLIEVRKGPDLTAFNIVDLGSTYYMFYMFNFRSIKPNVPGASDLLFHEIIRLAEAKEKRAINLGLGISAGVRRFKEKWGAVPFLDHKSVMIRRKTTGLFDRIMGSWKLT